MGAPATIPTETRIMLDRERQLRQASRARRYDADATYHEGQAKAARASVATICNTWSLDPITFEPLESQEPDTKA